jgi:hypothetical protein
MCFDFVEDPEPEGDDPDELRGELVDQAMTDYQATRQHTDGASGMPVRTTGERGDGICVNIEQEARPGVEDGDPAEMKNPVLDSVDLGLMGDANAYPQPDDDNPPPRPEMTPTQSCSDTTMSIQTLSASDSTTPPPDDPDRPLPGPEF